MHSRSSAYAFLCALALLGATRAAPAQSQKAAAEALFAEGRQLVSLGNFAQACPKFESSQRLDPSPSTLLNLGNCYEKSGRKASAWASYREALSLATAVKRADLVAVAERRARALESALSRLTIVVDEPIAGLTVLRDGVVVAAGEWGVAIPLDAGTHRIEAQAPQRKRWSASLDTLDDGHAHTVTIPKLEEAPAEPSSSASAVGASSGTAPSVPSATSGSAVPASDAAPLAPSRSGAPEVSRHEPLRTTGMLVGVSGLVGLAAGIGFAVAAKATYDSSLQHCPSSKNLCDATGVGLRDDARAFGDVSTVLFAAGSVLAVGGFLVYLAAPKARASVALVPVLGGFSLAGEW